MSYRTMPAWTPEFLAKWAKERQEGVQYVTPYGTVCCRQTLPSLSKEEITERSK